jgi:hypothetical protein
MVGIPPHVARLFLERGPGLKIGSARRGTLLTLHPFLESLQAYRMRNNLIIIPIVRTRGEREERFEGGKVITF